MLLRVALLRVFLRRWSKRGGEEGKGCDACDLQLSSLFDLRGRIRFHNCSYLLENDGERVAMRFF